MDGFHDWVGREQVQEERCDAWPMRGLAALLDHEAVPGQGDEIAPLAHWLLFAPSVPQSRIGSDGHPQRGGFLPPIAQPRRMWAGSDIQFMGPIRIGDRVVKTSRIASIEEKVGRTGTLVFVVVENRYETDNGPALSEAQTLVYREAPPPGELPPRAQAAPSEAEWSVDIDPDPVLLFRYSAVTFNAHRIHYDAPYANEIEHYSRPVVHGQLIATLMLNGLSARRQDRPLQRFSFRAQRPLLCDTPFAVEGARPGDDGAVALWSRTRDGDLTMSATAEFAA